MTARRNGSFVAALIVSGIGCGNTGSEALPTGLAYLVGDQSIGELWLLPVDPSADLAAAQEVRIDAPLGTPGRVVAFEWSPTGGRIAAVLGGGIQEDVRILSSTTPGETRVIATTALAFVSWDPAGRRLLHVDTEGRLWVTDSDGLVSARLSDRNITSFDVEDPHYGPTWSPDGRAVAFKDDVAAHVLVLDGVDIVRDSTSFWASTFLPSGAGIISLTAVDGVVEILCLATGASVALPVQPKPRQLFGISLSPDGHRLLTISADRDTGESSAALLELDGCAVIDRGTVPLSDRTVRHPPAWTADGRHVAFAEYDELGQGQVAVIDVDPLAPPRIVSTPGTVPSGVRALAAGARLLWTETLPGQPVRDLMISDEGAVGATRLADDVAQAEVVYPSPDGRLIAYRARKDQAQIAKVISTDGSRAAQELEGVEADPDGWSPRGEALAYTAFLPVTQRFVALTGETAIGPPREYTPDHIIIEKAWSP